MLVAMLNHHRDSSDCS